MPERQDEPEEREVYAQPRLRDYGDVTEVTALNTNGLRSDAVIPVGQPATFALS